MPESQTAERSLGLTGITSNARTLLAPAASAWILLSTQCLTGAAAADIFWGVLLALVLSIIAALAHARLAAAVSATGPSYFYVLKAAALQKNAPGVLRLLLLAAVSLYYFLYPALILTATSLLATYLVAQFLPAFGTLTVALTFCITYAMLITFVASRGVAGASQILTAINIIQISALLIFSFLAIAYRLHVRIDPLPATETPQYFHNAVDILRPHALPSILLQTLLALILFAGFESTATAAPRSNPKISRTILLIFIIQGACCYLFQYFAIEYAFTPAYGITEAAHSRAPLGDMMQIIAAPFFGTTSAAVGFMLIQAVTVFLVLVGLSLSSLTHAARVAYTMKSASSPVRGLWTLGICSATIASLALGIHAATGLFMLVLLCSIGILFLFLAIAVACLHAK